MSQHRKTNKKNSTFWHLCPLRKFAVGLKIWLLCVGSLLPTADFCQNWNGSLLPTADFCLCWNGSLLPTADIFAYFSILTCWPSQEAIRSTLFKPWNRRHTTNYKPHVLTVTNYKPHVLTITHHGWPKTRLIRITLEPADKHTLIGHLITRYIIF